MLVLDTNVLVAALRSREGASFRLMQLARNGSIEFAISVALALEYEAVLTRPDMIEFGWASIRDVESVLDELMALATQVMPVRTRLRPALRDADDDMVLECAVQSGASAIVTLNHRDFAAGIALFRTEVILPSEALQRIRQGAS